MPHENKSSEERTKQLKTLYARGVRTLEEMAETTGLKQSFVSSLAKEAEVILYGMRGVNPDLRKQVLIEQLEEGNHSLEDLCIKLSYKGGAAFYKFCNMQEIKLPALKPWKTRPEMDTLIEEGYTQTEIANELSENGESISRSYVDLYIKTSGQRNLHAQAMKKRHGKIPKPGTYER